jgi:hypothetical protein
MKVTFLRLLCRPGMTVQPGQTVDLPEAEARARIKAGVAKPAETAAEAAPAQPAAGPGPDVPGADVPLEDMTIPHLREYAAAAGIELTGVARKADILAVIAAAREAKEAEGAGGDDGKDDGGDGDVPDGGAVGGG